MNTYIYTAPIRRVLRGASNQIGVFDSAGGSQSINLYSAEAQCF